MEKKLGLIGEKDWDEYVKICPEIEKIEDIGLLRFGDFYIEKFIALKADILILPKWQYEAIDNTLKKKFEKAKVVLIVTDYANQQLETHINSTLAIGHAIGKLDRAKKITKYYEKQFNFVTDRIKKTVKRPSAYIEKGQKGAQIIDDTWSMVVWGAMLNTAGGKNIADGVIKKGKHGQLTREKILSSNPDYIFITGSNWVKSHNSLLMGYSVEKKEANQRLKTFSLRKGWNKLKAIKNDNLYAMHHGLARSLMDFSAIQFIAKKLHPEIFEDLDVMARLEEFHSKFLPVKFKGTWFLQIANE